MKGSEFRISHLHYLLPYHSIHPSLLVKIKVCFFWFTSSFMKFAGNMFKLVSECQNLFKVLPRWRSTWSLRNPIWNTSDIGFSGLHQVTLVCGPIYFWSNNHRTQHNSVSEKQSPYTSWLRSYGKFFFVPHFFFVLFCFGKTLNVRLKQAHQHTRSNKL